MGRDRGIPSLGTSEARRALPTLVKEASSRQHPSRSRTDNAIEMRPRGQEGSASLVPTIDIEAAEERIAALERERGELEEDLENAGIALLIHEPSEHAGQAPDGDGVPEQHRHGGVCCRAPSALSTTSSSYRRCRPRS